MRLPLLTQDGDIALEAVCTWRMLGNHHGQVGEDRAQGFVTRGTSRQRIDLGRKIARDL